jgi:hypothetical protein
MKRIWCAILLSVISLGIFAQGPVSLGPKIGWNSDRLTTDYTQYIKDMKSGYQGGLFVSFYIKRFYIQPEAYFSIKRGSLQTSIGDPLDPSNTLSIKQSVKLQTVDVPILVGFKVLDLKFARLRIFGGPVASFLLNKDYTLSVNGTNESGRITKDDFKDAFWTAQVGAGLDILMLTFDIGYEFGLNSFLTINSLDNVNFRNNLFYCSLGWRLF